MSTGCSRIVRATRAVGRTIADRATGYRWFMTEATNETEKSARIEAVQAVVDRVAAWQHGATDSTVLDEVRKGLTEVDVELDEGTVNDLASAIEADDGPVDASQVLG
ncbi:MAG: hypothetical protein JWQ74_1165 [Marmoricola sp.]|nr:hypothetical protein [Marmoricola sp.]